MITKRISAMQDQVHRKQWLEQKEVFSYHCSVCGERCSSNHADLQTERYIPLYAELATVIRGRGLGTWRCRVHGKVSVRRKVQQ